MASYNLPSRKGMQMEAASPIPALEDDVQTELTSRNRALTNEYILAELLSYLSVKDLKECRLVNLLWSQVATRMITPKSPPLKFGEDYGVESLEEFMETMSLTENLPCTKFEVNSELLCGATPEQQLLLPKFIEMVAPTVTHLSVCSENDGFFPVEKPKETTEYSKLKSLELPLRYMNAGTNVDKLTVDFMISILEHAPKLEVFSINFDLRDSFWSNDDAETLRVMEHVPWTKIRHWTLDGNFLGDDHFPKIVELTASMKLKSFKMEVWTDDDTYDEVPPQPTFGTHFQTFLDRQSGSLEALTLYFGCDFEPQLQFCFPKFPKLKTLEILFFNTTDAEKPRLLALPSFSQRFPALKSLTISKISWSKLCEFLRTEDKVAVDTVKTLKLHAGNGFSRVDTPQESEAQEIIRHMTQMFPRVRMLILPADLNIMKAIESEKAWPDLKHLTLLCDENESPNVDTALTGYSLEECKRISKLKPGSRKFRQEEKKIKTRIYNFLHGLETLELELQMSKVVNVQGHWRDSFFPDVSCKLVLLKLRNLKLLDLRALGSLEKHKYRVSQPAIEEMRTKFKVLYKK